MEKTKKTNIFQDAWSFIKKWILVLAFLFFIFYGVSYWFEGLSYKESGDLLNMIYNCVEGWGMIFLGCFFLAFEFILACFNRFSYPEPDESNQEASDEN